MLYLLGMRANVATSENWKKIQFYQLVFFCAKFDNLTIFPLWGENSRQICKFPLQFRLNLLNFFLWGENSPTFQSLQNKIKSLVETKQWFVFLVANFRHFPRKHKKKICRKFPVFWKKSPKIIRTAYNMKECLRFYSFIFRISPKLAKYIYGLLPLEQHHKIEKKKKGKSFY
jgi:hypothetical protein